MLTLLAKVAPAQLAAELPAIVPALSGCLCDAKLQVKVRGTAALLHRGSSTHVRLGCVCQVCLPSGMGSCHSPTVSKCQLCATRPPLLRCRVSAVVLRHVADAADVVTVQNAAVDCMTACCSVVGNRDVEPFVPTLISCMGNPAEVAEGIHKLGAITFVQVPSTLISRTP